MSSVDYARVEKAIRFLDENAGRQPELREVAEQVGMSEFHCQRLFRRWAGVSPKRFLQFITSKRAGELLTHRSALDASYELGLSSPSRLHDLMVSVNAVTPGEMRSGGAGLEIRWGVHPAPFGDCLIGITDRGVCELTFLSEEELREGQAGDHVEVLLGGTNFQLQVWRALLEIPTGQVTSYGDIARSIGSPLASRAVGSAVGANRIAYLIPCHRVIRGTSGFGGYRWGMPRKRAMLAWEALAGAAAGGGADE